MLDRHAATVEQPEDGLTARSTGAVVRIGTALDDRISNELDDNERGLKVR